MAGLNISVCESEINQLNQLVLDLDCEKDDIAKQLQCLESRGKKRKLEVNVWLRKLQEMKGSLDNMNNLNDTHDISIMTEKMKRHKEEKPLTLSTEYVGKKLDKNIHRVLKLLDDDKVFVIGIHGMGGVGKSLVATLVENEVKRKTTFKNVFWVTVSQNTNISKLQHDIARRIGVKLDEDDERIRAYSLSSALEKKEKSVLILDDVWRYIDLEKVGINPKVNGIKVIMTTRLKHVCHQMDCQPYATIQIYPLNCHKDDVVDEDWELFMLKLGHGGTPRTLPHEIEKIARCIVERFKGLPLGINVMARTMKGIDNIHEWKHALNKLHKLEMGQEVEEEVFKVLKRSYDNLECCFSRSCSFCTNIHKLEILNLGCLDSLTVICKEVVDVGQPLPPSRIFSCLKEIDIYGCNLIEKLMTPQLAQQLQNLETIRIQSCNSMKEIFAVSNNIDNDSSIIKLPKLTRLKLVNVPELKIGWKGIIRCRAFPRLERQPTIEIEDV